MATAKPPEMESMQSEEPAARPSRWGSKLKRLILIIVVLALIGSGAVVWLLLQKKNELSSGEEGAETVQQAATSIDLTRPPVFVPLDAFVVNLQPEGGERYLQVIMAVRVDSAKTGDALKNFMPEIRHRINLRLTGKLPSEINTPQGQEVLATEIAADINGVLGSALTGGTNAPVHSVLFNSFIIQ
ncbi:MAG: flagellar basal body-associated FliL family protein [Pseudazoarcus pumilus]|nr:flagellar basal body-associated FliL family protein [Pseudazoarcus pumilus]